MDKRRVEVKFTENLMESPETVINTIVREYLKKSIVEFSIDPGVIQSQIADKSLSIKATDVPGINSFDLLNEPDNRTGSFDFDSGMTEQLDDEIINGLKVPASALNALSEDEYSRSVASSNLFFSMEVSIDQDTTKKKISDLIRKYAKYSEEFNGKIAEIIPQLKKDKVKKKLSGSVSIDDNIVEEVGDEDQKEGWSLSDEYSFDSIIDCMSISLPTPNIAPSKVQFETIDAMITAITNTINNLFPDDLVGVDESMTSVIRLLRSRFISTNVRNYLDSAGLSHIQVPESNFTSELEEISTMVYGLNNIKAMLDDKVKIIKGSNGETSTDSSTAGF